MRSRMDFGLPLSLLVIQPDDAPHCIDLASANASAEMAVVCSQLNTQRPSPVAKDFNAWLRTRVLEVE